MLSRERIAESQAMVIQTFQKLRPELLGAFGSIEFERKHDSSPVTAWDVKVESTLQEALATHDSSIGFQGEETGHTGNEDTYWLVDPIDGTSSFIRGLDYCTNMAALVHNGEAVAAVIYDFVRDYTYTAIKGEGAFKDGQKITVNTKRRHRDLVVYSFTRTQFPLVKEALFELGMRALLPMGAAGHTYALLAEGKIDGVVALHTHMGAYDNAPGLLLAEEAGAAVLQYDDERGVKRHEFIVGSPLVVETIEHSGLI